MSRPLRIEYPGAWYHIMNRGANKQKIFLFPHHYRLFLSLLQEIHKKYQIEIHAYCLMNNHYHLLIRTRLPNLSKAMRHVDGVYTQRYNKMQKRDGALFKGRYKSIVVDADNYLLSLSRYIHLNPVAANITTKPENYFWSSYIAYINPQLQPDWLNTKITLDRFGNIAQIKKYTTFVNAGIDEETSSFFKKLKLSPILGDDTFITTITEKHLSEKKPSPEINEQKRINKKITSLYIVDAITQYYNISRNALLTSKPGTKNSSRTIAIYLCCKISEDKLTEIAKIFLLKNYASIAQIKCRFNKKMQDNKILAKEVHNIEKTIRTSFITEFIPSTYTQPVDSQDLTPLPIEKDEL